MVVVVVIVVVVVVVMVMIVVMIVVMLVVMVVIMASVSNMIVLSGGFNFAEHKGVNSIAIYISVLCDDWIGAVSWIL